MKLKAILTGMLIPAAMLMSSCGPKDSKIQENVKEKLATNAETSGASVSVTDGIATLTGEVATENGRAESEMLTKEVKGVKSVVNNLTVAQSVAAPVTITADDPLTTAVRDATKDHPGVNATVADGVITLTGEINRPSLQILMQKLNGLQPRKIENNLTVKN